MSHQQRQFSPSRQIEQVLDFATRTTLLDFSRKGRYDAVHGVRILMKMSDWTGKNLKADTRLLRRLNTEFEINLALEMLRQNPRDIEAITTLGLSYTASGEFEKALEMDRRLIELQPDDPVSHYNLACSYALLRDADFALQSLETAITKGYRDLDWLRKDEDLKNIRDDARFTRLVEELRAKLEPS